MLWQFVLIIMPLIGLRDVRFNIYWICCTIQIFIGFELERPPKVTYFVFECTLFH